jgi:hypothetical protein
MNSLFYCPRHNIVFDFVGGVTDISQRQLRLSGGQLGSQVRPGAGQERGGALARAPLLCSAAGTRQAAVQPPAAWAAGPPQRPVRALKPCRACAAPVISWRQVARLIEDPLRVMRAVRWAHGTLTNKLLVGVCVLMDQGQMGVPPRRARGL